MLAPIHMSFIDKFKALLTVPWIKRVTYWFNPNNEYIKILLHQLIIHEDMEQDPMSINTPYQ